jgi:hypothetical protein
VISGLPSAHPTLSLLLINGKEVWQAGLDKFYVIAYNLTGGSCYVIFPEGITVHVTRRNDEKSFLCGHSIPTGRENDKSNDSKPVREILCDRT